MEHAWLYSDLLPALKGKCSQLCVLNRWTLFLHLHYCPCRGSFEGHLLPIFLKLVFIPVSVQAKAVMITTVNQNGDEHIETLDVINMHVLGKNKPEKKGKICIYS